MRRDSAGSSKACGRPSCAVADQFPDGSKMVGRQCSRNAQVDPRQATGYRNTYIRPLVVGPLDHSERVPRPWGFFIFGAPRADGARS